MEAQSSVVLNLESAFAAQNKVLAWSCGYLWIVYHELVHQGNLMQQYWEVVEAGCMLILKIQNESHPSNTTAVLELQIKITVSFILLCGMCSGVSP